jgi:hypothetical protein
MDSVYVLGMNGIQQTGRLDQVARLKRVGTSIGIAAFLENVKWSFPQDVRDSSNVGTPWAPLGLSWTTNGYVQGAGLDSGWNDNNGDHGDLTIVRNNPQRIRDTDYVWESFKSYVGNSNNGSLEERLNNFTWVANQWVGQNDMGSGDGEYNGALNDAFLQKRPNDYQGLTYDNLQTHIAATSGVANVSHRTQRDGLLEADTQIWRTITYRLTYDEVTYFKNLIESRLTDNDEITRRYAIAASIRDQDLASDLFGDFYATWLGNENNYFFNSGVTQFISNFDDITKDTQRLSNIGFISPNQIDAINYIFGTDSTNGVTNVANFSSTTQTLDSVQTTVDNAVLKFVPSTVPSTERANFNKILKFSLSHSGSLSDTNIRNAVDRAKNIYNKLYSSSLPEDNITNLKNYLIGKWVHGVDYNNNPYEILCQKRRPDRSIDLIFYTYAKFSRHYVDGNLNQDGNLNRLTKYENIKTALNKIYDSNNKSYLDELAEAVQTANSDSYVNILNNKFSNPDGTPLNLQHGDVNKLDNINKLRQITSLSLEKARNLWSLIYTNDYESYTAAHIDRDPIKFFFEKLDLFQSQQTISEMITQAQRETQIAQALYEAVTPPLFLVLAVILIAIGMMLKTRCSNYRHPLIASMFDLQPAVIYIIY